MNCNDIYIYLHRYIDETLDEKSLRELKIHIETCAGCREKHDKFNRFFELLKSLPYSVEPPADLIELLSKELLRKSLNQINNERKTKIIDDIKKRREQSRQEKLLNETRGLTKKSRMSRSLKTPHSRLSSGKIILFIAAGVLIFSALAYYFYLNSLANSPWTVESVKGTFELNGLNYTDAFWYEGERLICSDSSRLRIIIPGEGRFELEGKSAALLKQAHKKSNIIFLEYGAVKTDDKLGRLGLTVEFENNELKGDIASYEFYLNNGNGELTVTNGAVYINDRIKIKDGYFVKFRNFSSGTPLRIGVDRDFENFVEQFDADYITPQTMSGITKNAKREDALSLLSILENSPLTYRGELFQAVANFFPPPPNVTYDGVIRLDKEMLTSWENTIEKSLGSQ
ncbi:hypothetical protein MROS_0819 [Melioribacter roseus P3M-2]|uniref:Putative zinc-finger domain-containing protein n=1 Tax=Melioribacter roseus (strain DSM 23840 / JCM 17771 / VKM B-2668 / P3M-2) TaxID=1191523 RepID=I6Z4J4_MELRP|nr:zf-HC2 domain-containing protein [Melioribacter roseus]AFN74060.1 hypothetical protein MROS_0819 [Melioribacter roseus P3M-2]